MICTQGLKYYIIICYFSIQILNLPVIGSEIVGLVSLQIMLSAADYYIQKENLFIVHEHQKIRLAVQRLGLNQLDAFNPAEKIIEYRMLLRKDGKFVGSSIRQFVEHVSARSSTPGGGSVSACIAAMVSVYMCVLCVFYNKISQWQQNHYFPLREQHWVPW